MPIISLRVNAHYHHIVLHYPPCDNPAGICAIRSFEKSVLVKCTDDRWIWRYLHWRKVQKRIPAVVIGRNEEEEKRKEKGLYYILIYSDNCCHLGYFNETNDRYPSTEKRNIINIILNGKRIKMTTTTISFCIFIIGDLLWTVVLINRSSTSFEYVCVCVFFLIHRCLMTNSSTFSFEEDRYRHALISYLSMDDIIVDGKRRVVLISRHFMHHGTKTIAFLFSIRFVYVCMCV